MIEQLFGSKTRVKLLGLFLQNPDRSFFVREITRKIDEQINSVRRELANLTEVGIVKSESNNNKLYYQVNQASQHYQALKMMFTSDSISQASSPHAVSTQMGRSFAAVGDVSLVILSGSFVQHDELSLDILIVGNVQRRKLAALTKELEQEERRPLSYAVLSDKDFNYRYTINDRFVSQILKHKHIIVLDKYNILGEALPDNTSTKKKGKK